MSEVNSDDVSALKQRIKELEDDLDKKDKRSFWVFDTWKDSIQSLSLPIALIMMLFAFWNTIILGVIGQDSGSIQQVKGNIEAIQAMDQELYVLQEEGQDARANAKEAAIVARRDRIVAETYDYWLQNESYFRPAELQILIHHLIIQYRTSDALEVFQKYWPTLTTTSQQAEGKVLEARIYAREGPVFNIDKSIDLLKEAFTISEEINNDSTKLITHGQIVYKRGSIELHDKGDCKSAKPYIEVLTEMAVQDRSGNLNLAANNMNMDYDSICGG